MPAIRPHLIDRNSDGFIDDADARIRVDPEPDAETHEFWARLVDAGALLGLQSQALPLPLFISHGPAGDETLVTVRTIEDIDELGLDQDASYAGPSAPKAGNEASTDLLDLFSINGLLEDRNGDLLPDATNFAMALPDDIPVQLGVALCNFAVRVGLESGGVTLPLVSSGDADLRVDVGDGPATFSVDDEGWLATGRADELGQLLERIAQDWPFFGIPETAGARAGVESLASKLAGSAAASTEAGEVLWELQWSAQPETERLIDSVRRSLLPKVETGSHVDLVVFACEPLSTRLKLRQTLIPMIEALGASTGDVHVLSAFKTGLSWLREVVLPDLAQSAVQQLNIRYRRFEAPEGQAHLDMPIRWLQELFPGDEIAAAELEISLDAIRIDEDPSPTAPIYRATAFDSDGEALGSWELDVLSYSTPFMPNADESDFVEVTTGGFIASVDGERVVQPVDTDLDRFWKFWQGEALPRVIGEIERGGGFHADHQPFFGSLDVEVWLSAPNSHLGIREENDSAAEALHEDIYFNTLDTIEVLGASRTGDTTSAPGAVIPIVHIQEGIAPHAVVRLRKAADARPTPPPIAVRELSLDGDELVCGLEGEFGEYADTLDEIANESETLAPALTAYVDLDGRRIQLNLPLPELLGISGPNGGPPMDQNIHGDDVETWAARVGQAETVAAWIEGHSYQGRPIPALALRSPAPGRVWSATKLAVLKPTALIVARHHANEIASTNAAFQLAHLVGSDATWVGLVEKLNIIIVPYENADGAALHARLAGQPAARTWKHHPARYNALGHEFGEDYFDPDTPFGEARVRPALWRRWLPDALVDNHGVPSHEWVQPFAGFGSPPRFRVSYWIPQALIYGIARYVDDPEFPAHQEAAISLRDAVSAAFRSTPIGDLNREIGASYRRWGQEREPERFPGEFHDDMLWHFAGTDQDSEGRGFNVRFPKTTVLSWVTEVNDETATGEHLRMVSGAHLIANKAMLDLLTEMNQGVRASVSDEADGRKRHRFSRGRPLRRG